MAAIGETAEFAEGQEIGSYRIVRPLGSGGMGRVYEAEHRHLGVRYALKTLAPSVEHAEEFRKRFAVEGQVLARLNHPNLVRVIDLDIDEATGTPYFVMDLVLGENGEPRTLAEAGAGGSDEDCLRRWFGELCSALDYIHSQGVVHRDIKLENVLLDRDGHVRLSDFGISRITNDGMRRKMDVVQTLVTNLSGRSSLVMGTQGYMAPEVLRGEPAVPASDVYSLGVAFFRLLTHVWYDPTLGAGSVGSGKRAGSIFEMLKFFEYDWGAVLPKMLSADPKLRPTHLQELAAGLTAGVRPRHRWWRVVAIVVAGALLAVVAYRTLRTRDESARVAPPEEDETTVRDVAPKPVSPHEFDEAFGAPLPGRPKQ